MRRTYFWYSELYKKYRCDWFVNATKADYNDALKRWNAQDEKPYWSFENVPSHILNQVTEFDYEKEDLT